MFAAHTFSTHITAQEGLPMKERRWPGLQRLRLVKFSSVRVSNDIRFEATSKP